MTPFRKLTSAETAALEALGNSAEDWSKVAGLGGFQTLSAVAKPTWKEM